MGVDTLIEGYRHFKEGRYKQQKDLFDSLVKNGQSPEVMIIACCDSRVDPTIIMNADPGLLFTVRNIAALVPPSQPDDEYHGTSAALEFAVKELKVKHIVIKGHSGCGGIKALYEGESAENGGTEFIDPWMRMAGDARDHIKATCAHEAPDQQLRLMGHEGVRVSLRNLMTFSWIREAVDAGDLQLHGWYFDLDEARLFTISPDTADYQEII